MNSKSSPLENSKRASSVGATQQDLGQRPQGHPRGQDTNGLHTRFFMGVCL